MRKVHLRVADRVALIALGGVFLSLFVWLVFAFIQGVIISREGLFGELFLPDPGIAWQRLVAIVAVLLGTLAVQILSAKHLESQHQVSLERNRSRGLYENSPDRIVSLDPRGVLVTVNDRARAEGNIESGADLAALPCHELLYQKAERCEDCPLEAVLSDSHVREHTVEVADLEGRGHWFNRLIYPVLDADGHVESVVEAVRDVTVLKEAEEALVASNRALEERVESRTAALTASELRYRSLVETAPDMILVHDGEHVTFVNAAGLQLLGVEDPRDVVGCDIFELWEPGGVDLDAEAMFTALRDGTGSTPASLRLKRFDGSLVDVELSSTVLTRDGSTRVQCIARDISERVRAQETIQRMAYYDSLTGLPNRTLFFDRLDTQLARSRRSGSPFAVIFIDIDDFKVVNDTLGHAVGDELLRSVALRLKCLLRESDTVAHQSGDEFLIIAELSDPGDVARLAERLKSGLMPAFPVAEHELHIRTSFGIAVSPNHGTDAHELLKNADTAMYRSKEGTERYSIYSDEMGAAAQERRRLEVELRQAIDEREFVLHFQPQVDVRSERIAGVEALLRWRHPTRGLLTPAAFLEVAENTGLITRIGRLVLEQATLLAKSWHDDGLDFGKLAVNLSAREFLQPDLIQSVEQALARSSLPAHLLELEITESVAMHSGETVLSTLDALRALGVRIAIDDFGTGYSSMSYLQRFPVQTLKIDQAFTRDVCHNAQSAAIAGTLIELCHVLDLDIVAEGVETAEQAAFLQERGAHVVQGFAFYRPLSEEDFRTLMETGLEIPTAS